MLEELAQLYDYTEPVAINGVFDSATESAVKMIQRSLDLDGDGIVDILTWNGMARLYNSLQSGNIDSSGT
jgi:peptidoglycan hydrolase-like protein with peptidoglycan-binding domain